MATRIKGSAIIKIDYVEEDDLNDLEAEDAFNEAIAQASSGYFEYGFADYDQRHEFGV